MTQFQHDAAIKGVLRAQQGRLQKALNAIQERDYQAAYAELDVVKGCASYAMGYLEKLGASNEYPVTRRIVGE